jgi:hypothetical protein
MFKERVDVSQEAVGLFIHSFRSPKLYWQTHQLEGESLEHFSLKMGFLTVTVGSKVAAA